MISFLNLLGYFVDNNRQLLLPTSDTSQNFDRSLYKNDEYEKEHNIVHLPFNHNIETIQRTNIDANNLCEQNLDNIQNVYTNLQSASKKRKLSQDSAMVKSEPGI